MRRLGLGLGLARGGRAPIVCLLRDLFITDRAAGAVNGTAAEPGPGTRTVVDTESLLFIGNPAYKYALYIGDSKTANYSWPQLALYKPGSTVAIRETPARIAQGGWTVGDVRGVIDARLTAAVGVPDYVSIDLGINDTGGLPAEAVWKANYQYILNAVHAKYPAAAVYLATVWRADVTFDADRATINGWIGDLIAANPTFCHAGIDEAAILPGHHDGDAHPDASGVLLYAAAWRTVLGY